MTNGTLKDGERLDDLNTGGLKLIQRSDGFRFTTDSVLLADFANPKKWDKAVDLGCGTGVIAILMADHQPELRVRAVEIQADVANMAARSVLLNGMESRISVHNTDMRECWHTLGAEKYSLVVCNPPYGKNSAAIESRDETKRISRHECDLTLREICFSASKLLKSGGRFCTVFPAPRAFEMMCAMRENRLAPKRIRIVQGVEGYAPKIVLMDAIKDGGEGLHWLPPLILQNRDGSYTDEWKSIYRIR